MKVICKNAGIYALTEGREYEVIKQDSYSYWINDDDGDCVFCAKTRFEPIKQKQISNNTNKMKIGDKVIPTNVAGTTSLDPNKEYIVVDINSHGNIGLKDPAAGCLLEHYYRPERLKIAPVTPPEPEIKLGQIWNYNEDFQYCREGYLMVVRLSEFDKDDIEQPYYAAINIATGKQHYPAVKDIHKVFARNKIMFCLIANSLEELLKTNN